MFSALDDLVFWWIYLMSNELKEDAWYMYIILFTFLCSGVILHSCVVLFSSLWSQIVWWLEFVIGALCLIVLQNIYIFLVGIKRLTGGKISPCSWSRSRSCAYSICSVVLSNKCYWWLKFYPPPVKLSFICTLNCFCRNI